MSDDNTGCGGFIFGLIGVALVLGGIVLAFTGVGSFPGVLMVFIGGKMADSVFR